MGILDQFLAFAAPASFQALQNYNDNTQFNNDLKQFQADPQGFKLDASKYTNSEHAMKVGDHLNTLGAAPALNELSAIKRDPSFQDPASLQVLAQENPLGTTMQKTDGTWMQRPDINNPVVTKGISDFQQGSQNVLDAFKAHSQDPMAIARIANSPAAQTFHQAEQGANQAQTNQDNAAKAATSAEDRRQVAKITNFIAKSDTGTYGDGTPGSFMTSLNKTLRDFQVENGLTIGAADAVVEKYLKSQYDQKKGQAWDTRSKTIGTGNATKRIDEVIDPHGNLVRTESVVNHAPVTKESKDRYQIVTAEDGTQMNVNLDTGVAEPITADGKAVKKPAKAASAFAELVKNGGKATSNPTPTGTTVSGKAYYTWTDGSNHYSPQPGK